MAKKQTQEAQANDASDNAEGQEEVKLIDGPIGQAFTAAVEDGKGEDDVKLAMIKAGSSFKTVTREYNELMVASGRMISKEDKAELVKTSVGDNDLSTEEGFNGVVKAIVSGGKGIDEKSAAASVRAYAKKNELPCYVKPKGEGGNRNPFVTNFHEALVENPHMDEQGLKDVIAALDAEHQVNPTRWFSQHNNIRKTVNKIAEKYGI